jgi:hypothetical protein
MVVQWTILNWRTEKEEDDDDEEEEEVEVDGSRRGGGNLTVSRLGSCVTRDATGAALDAVVGADLLCVGTDKGEVAVYRHISTRRDSSAWGG